MNKKLITEIERIKKLSNISEKKIESINESVLNDIGKFFSKVSPKLLELPAVKKLKDFYEKIKSKEPLSSDVNLESGQLDLQKPEHFYAYKTICNKFISKRNYNFLGLTGEMFATAAKKTQLSTGKYIPPELALSQAAIEGAFSKDRNAIPIRTKNPFNVGNTDSGKKIYHGSVQDGIQAYYDLIARNYLVKGKTANDLMNNFVNKNGNRYASGAAYEEKVKKIASSVKQLSEPIYASLKPKTSDNIA
jgi:hypothetical protein